ncbi:hypothetical protein SNL152K_9530 [Streptomyces sp. NL15-2K]|nr:hypothetical protein SNL152K_9530 [Streptomyces sp. NL15-2K]
MVGVDVGVGLHMEGHQLSAVPLRVEHGLLGAHLAALGKVDEGGEQIDRGNGHAGTSILR